MAREWLPQSLAPPHVYLLYGPREGRFHFLGVPPDKTKDEHFMATG